MSAYSLKPVTVTDATLTLDYDKHNNTVVVVNRAAGCTVTLPAASGSGACFTLLVGTTISSNSFKVQVANASDTMIGQLSTATTTLGSGTQESAGGTDDTITMNGTTTGGIAGSMVKLVDAAENLWLVDGTLVGSGTLATSLSAAVS